MLPNKPILLSKLFYSVSVPLKNSTSTSLEKVKKCFLGRDTMQFVFDRSALAAATAAAKYATVPIWNLKNRYFSIRNTDVPFSRRQKPEPIKNV